jgi:NAD(P)-dependent dehydrogenase (short-subunit alcohol dehydrogenase family)
VTGKKVWLITGAGRGLGVDIARPSWQLATRFAAGADAVQTFETKAKALLAQANAHHELSTSLVFHDA